MTGADATETLQRILTHKRAQLRPETVGLVRPSGRGRRALGVTQDQMDELLERSPGTYARFERGVLKGVTPEFCHAVATTLRFSETEWQGLWLYLFGHQPPHPLDPAAAVQVGPHWQDVVDNMTYPAYVTDQGWNLLAWNSAFAAIFTLRIPPENTMRWMLLDPNGRRQLVDWSQQWAPLVMPQLRAAAQEYPANATLQQLECEVRRDPVAGPMYERARDAYLQPDGDVRRLMHLGLGGTGQVQIAAATPLGSPGARLMFLIFHPDRRAAA